MQKVTDIALDYGRVPYCWYEGQRKFLHEGQGDTGEEVVKKSDLECIVESLGRIGGDNRTGIDKQLHRISCIRENERNVIGLTLRVGRHVKGNADIIRDLLEDSTGSILILGEVSLVQFRAIKYQFILSIMKSYHNSLCCINYYEN